MNEKCEKTKREIENLIEKKKKKKIRGHLIVVSVITYGRDAYQYMV